MAERGVKLQTLVRSIKADVARGQKVTLVALNLDAIAEYAAELTDDELRFVRFEVPGAIFIGKQAEPGWRTKYEAERQIRLAPEDANKEMNASLRARAQGPKAKKPFGKPAKKKAAPRGAKGGG